MGRLPSSDKTVGCSLLTGNGRFFIAKRVFP